MTAMTDAQLRNLMSEAESAGDGEIVAYCQVALRGAGELELGELGGRALALLYSGEDGAGAREYVEDFVRAGRPWHRAWTIRRR